MTEQKRRHIRNRAEKISAIIENFSVVKQALTRSMSRSAMCTVPASQWLALSVIARQESASIKDIRATLGISSPAATQLVKSLEKAQMVRREINRGDKRQVSITLTPSTRALFVSVKKQQLKSLTKLFAALSDRELDVYLDLNSKVAQSYTND